MLLFGVLGISANAGVMGDDLAAVFSTGSPRCSSACSC